jgi:outer membrane protein TolC
VADAVQSRRRLDVQIQEAGAALTSTERAYRLAELRYSSGAADYQSVLIVEDRLLARRRILAALTARTFVLNIALVRALGGEPL